MNDLDWLKVKFREGRKEGPVHTVSTSVVFACPYYRTDAKDGSISCDCGKIKFGNRREALRYFGEFCANNPGWEQCTLAKHMTAKLLREDEDERHD